MMAELRAHVREDLALDDGVMVIDPSAFPMDQRLHLPKDWAGDETRRDRRHVPPGVELQARWQIGLDLLDISLTGLDQGWNTAMTSLVVPPNSAPLRASAASDTCLT